MIILYAVQRHSKLAKSIAMNSTLYFWPDVQYMLRLNRKKIYMMIFDKHDNNDG